MEYLLWLGGIFTEDSMLRNTAISPAANRWQSGLISALVRQNCHVTMISHLPEPLWPKGKLTPGRPADLDPRFENSFVHYWNVPLFRAASLRRAYVSEFHEVCRGKGKPFAVVSYNPSPHAISTGLLVQRYYNIPWIDVCADHLDPGADWSRYASGADMARGHVFLSYQAFQNCPFPKKMHLDGGVSGLRIVSAPQTTAPHGDKKIILYTGMMSVWGGVSFLVKAFKKVQDPTAELWICGHGKSSSIQDSVRRDSRIRYFGFVPEDRLQEIYRQATVLVNPRPAKVPGNAMNFPSKVLEYLSHGKPVISTWTPGLSPEYHDVLEVLQEETEECFAKKIEDVLSWPQGQRESRSMQIRDFLLKNKTWEIQATRLLDWLRKEIL